MELDQAGSQFSSYSTENSGYKTFYEYLRDVEGIQGPKEGHDILYNSFLGKIADFFTGIPSAQRERYNVWLANNQREYEQQQINDARAYQEYMDSSKYQRMSKDLKAAGLNPWLAVQNGVGNATVSPGSSSYSTSAYKSSSGKSSSGDKLGSVVTSAMRLAMLAITLMA